MWFDIRRGSLVLALLFCAGCSEQVAGPAAATSSPTIAALAVPNAEPAAATSSPTMAALAVPTQQQFPTTFAMDTATSTPTPVIHSTGAAPTVLLPTPTTVISSFVYLWPSYLPEGMSPSPTESRVAQEAEIGVDGMGFYIVTFNAGSQKLVVGGGRLVSALPLNGDERRISVGTRQATLVTNGDQRQVIFDVPRGKLFVYSVKLSEAELLRVADSLQPIEAQELRERVGSA